MLTPDFELVDSINVKENEYKEYQTLLIVSITDQVFNNSNLENKDNNSLESQLNVYKYLVESSAKH